MKVEMVRVDLVQGECGRWIRWGELLADEGVRQVNRLNGSQNARLRLAWSRYTV